MVSAFLAAHATTHAAATHAAATAVVATSTHSAHDNSPL